MLYTINGQVGFQNIPDTVLDGGRRLALATAAGVQAPSKVVIVINTALTPTS